MPTSEELNLISQLNRIRMSVATDAYEDGRITIRGAGGDLRASIVAADGSKTLVFWATPDGTIAIYRPGLWTQWVAQRCESAAMDMIAKGDASAIDDLPADKKTEVTTKPIGDLGFPELVVKPPSDLTIDNSKVRP